MIHSEPAFVCSHLTEALQWLAQRRVRSSQHETLQSLSPKHHNLSAAANEVCITQAAASMSLSQLETQLGQPLFDREGKKLILNPLGKQVLPQANAIIQKTTELELSVAKPDGFSGHIHIGASSTIANYILPTLLNNFTKKYPDITFELSAFNTEDCVKKLLNFEIDSAWVEGLHLHPKIEYIPWKTDQLAVFCHPKHPLSKQKNIKPNDLSNYPWVLREPASGTRQVLESALAKSTINLNNITVMNSSQAINHYICANPLALSCLSESILTNEIKAKKLTTLKIKSWQLERNFYQAIYKDKNNTSACQLLTKQLFNDPTLMSSRT